MHVKTILPVIGALFAISMLLMSENLEYAYATSFTKVASIDENVVASFADHNTSTLWVVTNGGAGNRWLYDFNLADNVFRSKHNISINYVAAKAPQDIWCGRTDCFITFGIKTSNTAENDGSGSIVRIATIATSGLSKGDIKYPIYNTTGSNPVGGLYKLTGKDSLTGGFGGINLWVDSCYTTHAGDGCRHRIILVDGITMGLSASFPEFFSGSAGMHATDILWNNEVGVDGLLAVSLDNPYSVSGSANIQILNAGNFQQHCNSVSSGQSPQGSDVGALEWDTVNGKIYQLSNAADAQHISVINESCIYQSYITTSTTGLSDATGMRAITLLEDRDLMLVQEAGANARISVMAYSNDGVLSAYQSIHNTFPTTSQSASVGEFTIRKTFNSDGSMNEITNKIWVPYSGADRIHLFIELGADPAGGGGGGTPFGEICFVVQSTGANVCYDLDENGNPIIGSVIEPVASQFPLIVVVGNYMCQLGIETECTNGSPTNTNAETNGTGYILWFSMWAVFMAIAGSALFGKVKAIDNIMILVVILFITTALAVVLNWIPERDFYILVFIVIGFSSIATTKFVLGHRRGGASAE